MASSSLSWAVQQSHHGLPFTFLGCGLCVRVLVVSDARAMGWKCWLVWSLLWAFDCGGALVRRSDRMELRVGLVMPDDVDVSAGWVLVVVYPPRLQGLEVGAVALLSLLVGELGS